MNPLSVLVIADRSDIQASLRSWLQSRDHRVCCASGENQAAIFRDARCSDLVVADILRPSEGAAKLIGKLKQACESVRILAIFGGGLQVKSTACIQFVQTVGAHALLLKPFKEEQFFQAIDRIFCTSQGHDRPIDRSIFIPGWDNCWAQRGRSFEARFLPESIFSRESP